MLSRTFVVMDELECTPQLSEAQYHSFDCSEVGTQYYIGDFDDLESTPQISETQSQSVDSTEIVTQDYMVPEQLENERLRKLSKQTAHENVVLEYRTRKLLRDQYVFCFCFFLAFK